jgi:hypothetical protein
MNTEKMACRGRAEFLTSLTAVSILIAVMCARSQADAPAAPNVSVPTTRPYRGVFMQVQSLDDLPAYEKAVDKIADTGADTIQIGTQVRQENGTSAQIFMDLRYTPTPAKLGELIDYCRGRHLRVSLMPIMILTAPRSNEWRGKLKPASWAEWFSSYREVIDIYAEVAQAHGVDLLVVGTELVTSEDHLDEWTKTIASVRERFHGNLTYSANWDHYRNIPFWDQLDAIGLNCYYRLGDGPDVTVEQIKQNWGPIHERLVDFASKKNKPLIFTEAGWCSLSNAATDLWDYTKADLPTDNELQTKLYQGFLETWYGDPALVGIMMQEWTPGPPDEKGFTPEGKPAEKLLRTFFAKPAWKIQPSANAG